MALELKQQIKQTQETYLPTKISKKRENVKKIMDRVYDFWTIKWICMLVTGKSSAIDLYLMAKYSK